MEWLKQNALNIILAALVAFTVAYLFSNGFRAKIISMNIDAGMIAGLVASFALLVSIKQGIEIKKQSVRNMNFAYRMNVKSKFEDMAQIVIAKLYSIDNRRHACVATMGHLKQVIGTDTQYRDGYSIASTDAFNSDNLQSTAALDVYFPLESEKWNEVIDILNEMGSIASTTLLNYTENDYGKKSTNYLDNIDRHIARVKELDEKMGNKPQEIRDGIIEEVNKHTLNISKV